MIDEAERDRLVLAAQEALRRVWGGEVSVRLEDPIRTEWGRHALLRCVVRSGQVETPRTVVVKAAVDQDAAIFNEWAVLQFANTVSDVAPLVPDIYAGDMERELIVIEDIGAGPLMRRLLQAGPGLARPALIDSQRLLGRCNGALRGRAAELGALRALLPDGPPPPVFDLDESARIAEAAAWGIPPSDAMVAEVGWAIGTLDVDETFTTLTFHDSCPPNRIVTATGMRALDLEIAAFRHPMVDGAYSSIGYLRCNDGLSIPAELRSAMLDAYRREVITGYPEYTSDEKFNDDLAAAGAIWLLELLRRNHERAAADRTAGFFGITARQRVLAAIDAFIALSAITRGMPALAVWADELRAMLTDRWGPVPPLPHFPGFRSS